MKRFLPYYTYLRPALKHFGAAVLCGIIYGIASGAGLPFLTKEVLPIVFGDGKSPPTPTDLILVKNWHGWVDWPPLSIPGEYLIAVAVGLLPVMFAIRAASHFANTYLLNLVGLRVLEGVRAAVFARLQALQLGFFKRHSAGDLTSRIMVDTNHVKAVVVDISNDLIIQPFTLIGAIGFFIYMSLTHRGMGQFLLALLMIPLVVFPIRYFGKKIRRRSEQTLAQMGNLSAVLTENLQSLREVRAYNLEERENLRFTGHVRSLFRVQLKAVKYEKMLSPLIEFVSACSIAFAIYQASQANVSEESVIAIVTAIYIAYEPVKKLGNIHNKMKAGLAGLSRLEEILHAPIEIADPANPLPLPAVHGKIRFENVTFAYDKKPVLREINVTVTPGEIVALVGPSGAGKSTFANLVPRFYDPQQGAVHIEGLDVRTVRQSELRNHIALVSQEPILFNETIYDNILLGSPTAPREAVHLAAEQAGARKFIEALPQAWETPVGERGGRLSGGQRQRIAIARAFLKNAPILILDEATSALDAENEAIVQEALEKLAHGKTTFIIAHRFSTIRFATRILVFDKGRIVADGTHTALIENSKLYRTLYQRQSGSAE